MSSFFWISMTIALQQNPFILPCIVGAIILIPELLLLLTRHSRSRSIAGVDRRSLAYLWGAIISGIVIAIPFAYFQIPENLYFELEEPGLIIAFSSLIIGMLLRYWSIYILGQFFTVNVAVHRDHRLVARGPYAWIRHPSYTGLLLELLALALTFQHAISLAFIMIPTMLAVLHRITIEEQAMKDILGDEYREYQHRTYVLLPFIY